MNALLISGIIFFSATLYLYHKFVDALRIKACFDLYAVRDELIYLVVTEKLTESNEVFQYYYGRVNKILECAPNVGIDDILYVLFRVKDGRDFDEIVKQAKEKVKKMQSDPVFNDPAVRAVVKAYYQGVHRMILAHSSFIRALYFVIIHVTNANKIRLNLLSIIPFSSYKNAVKTAIYADHEARQSIRPVGYVM